MRVVDIVIGVGWVLFWVGWFAASAGAKRGQRGRGNWARFAGVRVVLILVVVLLVRLRVLTGHGVGYVSDPVRGASASAVWASAWDWPSGRGSVASVGLGNADLHGREVSSSRPLDASYRPRSRAIYTRSTVSGVWIVDVRGLKGSGANDLSKRDQANDDTAKPTPHWTDGS